MVKNLLVLIIILTSSSFANAQIDSSYVVKDRYDIKICDTIKGLPQTIIYGNSTGHSQFIFKDKNIEDIFNDYKIFIFRKLYPSFSTPSLRYYYTIKCSDTTSAFVQRLKNYDSTIYCMWRRVNKIIIPEDPSSINEVNLQNVFITDHFHPNPTSNGGEVGIFLTKTSYVTLTVSNLLGQTMITQDLGKTESGNRTIEVSTTTLASGVYMYTIATEEYAVSCKMVVNK